MAKRKQEAPGTLETAETPEVPETPKVPETPETPEVPETPDRPPQVRSRHQLEVRSRVPAGHRRAGRAWPSTWTAVPSSFTPAQIEKLRADPHLQVRAGHSKGSR